MMKKILYFCDATRSAESRSGIHRVIVEAARALVNVAEVDFVVWNELEGQLKYANRSDLQQFFRDPAFAGSLPIHPAAGRVNDRFGNSIDPEKDTWLLFPEIAYHCQNGNERFSRLLNQMREYGIPVASIFYDIIPIVESGYEVIRKPHTEYVKYLLGSEVILPISSFCGDELLEWVGNLPGISTEMHRDVAAKVYPLRIAEARELDLDGDEVSTSGSINEKERRIISVGAIEPRKQQTLFLKAFNDLLPSHPELTSVRIDLFGSLHPDSSDSLAQELARNPKIQKHGYTDEAIIDDYYRKADLSFFVSRREGFGLPIVESLRRNVPCICANFGSMAEVANGGGCYTIDVRSLDEIQAAILSLVNDVQLLQNLTDAAIARKPRTWEDYAKDLIGILTNLDDTHQKEQARMRSELIETGITTSETGQVLQIVDLREQADVLEPGEAAGHFDPLRALRLGASPTKSQLEALPDFDICQVPDKTSLEAIKDRFADISSQKLLPPRFLTGTSRAGLECLAAALVERGVAVERLQRVARNECLLVALGKATKNDCPKSDWTLAIVISTFNRASFVAMNVEWLLELTKPYASRVKVVVVDNCSTDSTMELLAPYHGAPNLEIHRNNANTGMLGNLNVCSAHEFGARHVWITGDDDYIQPSVLKQVFEELEENPELPLGFVNFGVYHRFEPSHSDTPKTYRREATALAPKASKTDTYSVREIATQHDNLFTAVYPIIWRSDILASCFNYPFTGIPFSDLVECVPTTKIILETYAQTQAKWFSEIGTVGNAHNSWSRHRPRWHSILMPQIFELARDVGVDSAILQKWSEVHWTLYEEAVAIALEKKLLVHLDSTGLEHGRRVFRKKLEVPAELTQFTSKEQLINWWVPNA